MIPVEYFLHTCPICGKTDVLYTSQPLLCEAGLAREGEKRHRVYTLTRPAAKADKVSGIDRRID